MWYDSSQAFLAWASPDNAPQTANTVTAPAGAAYARMDFSTTQLTTMQFEKGASQTSYVAYGVTIAGLNVPTNGPVAALRSGDNLTISSQLGAATLVISGRMNRSDTNNAFSLDGATLDGVLIHGGASGDEVTPIRTQLGTIGADHGYACVAEFTNPDSKVTADLGSRWTDGTREYVLLAITTTNTLVLGGSYTTSAGVVSSVTVAPTTNLTHVAGATHTAAIVYTTQVASQLYPSTGRVTTSVWVDGAPLISGQLKGRQVTVKETYEIYDYADLYDKAKANVGTSYTALNVAGAVRVTNSFIFTAGGRCRVSSTLTELKPTTLGVCGFVQSVVLAKSGATTWRYLPGVGTIGGYTWGTGVDLTSYALSLIVTWTDFSTPPSRRTSRWTDWSSPGPPWPGTRSAIPHTARGAATPQTPPPASPQLRRNCGTCGARRSPTRRRSPRRRPGGGG